MNIDIDLGPDDERDLVEMARLGQTSVPELVRDAVFESLARHREISHEFLPRILEADAELVRRLAE